MTSISGFAKKEKKIFSGIVNAFLPSSVVIPFAQKRGERDFLSLVSAGDFVLEGQTIGSSEFSTIHSSIPGIVTDIVQAQISDGRLSMAAKIRLNGSFSFRGKKTQKVKWDEISEKKIISSLALKGVINTFYSDKPVPLAEQMSLCKDFVAVRLYDEDPACCVDETLSKLHIQEIYEGALIVSAALGARGIVFISPRRTAKTPVEANNEKYPIPVFECKIDDLKTPCSKRDICKTVRAADAKAEFQINLDSLFTDALTMLHVYNAVTLDMPVINQYVHVTGNCLKASGILKVCIGDSIAHLAQMCGGFIKQPSKIVINGVMKGRAVSCMDVPITPFVKSVSFLAAGESPGMWQRTCVRCGYCRSICPMKLCPDILYGHIARGTPIDNVYIKSAQLCSDCALCNTICPSRLPLAQSIALLKDDSDE